MVWAQWGLEDKLLTDADAWLCFQCNDCITPCPVDARPGDVMAATAISRWRNRRPPLHDPDHPRPEGTAAGHRHPGRARGLMVLGSQTFAGGDGVSPKVDVLFGHFLGEGWVDTFVMTLVMVIGALSFLSLKKFWAGLQSTVPAGTAAPPCQGPAEHRGRRLQPQGLRRLQHGPSPDVGPHGAVLRVPRPDGRHQRGLHLHAGLPPHRDRPPRRRAVAPIWDPVKIVGNVGGVALLAGLGQTLWVRLKRPQQSGKSAYSDWFFSGLLGLTAVTGFVTEILRYAQVRTAAYISYVVHLVFIFGLFAYFPFSKFSHLMYRSAAMTFARQIGRTSARKVPCHDHQ